MSTLSSARPAPRKTWTVADLYRRFGPIPFERIRQNPPPGSGTVDDVVRLNDHEDRLYELVDGILVEKTVGLEESLIAMQIGRLLEYFVEPRELGFVAGEGDDPARYQPGSDSRRFVHLVGANAGRRIPEEPIPLSFPTWLSRSSAGATPVRRWRRSSRSISRKEFAWSGSCGHRAESSTSTRRRTTLPG